MYWKTEHKHNYCWDQVAKGFWKRYPNPNSQHVFSEDIIASNLEGSVLQTKRVIMKTNKLPSWGRHFFSARRVPVIEESFIDASKKEIITYTRNIGFENIYGKFGLSQISMDFEEPLKSLEWNGFKSNSVKATEGFDFVLRELFTVDLSYCFRGIEVISKDWSHDGNGYGMYEENRTYYQENPTYYGANPPSNNNYQDNYSNNSTTYQKSPPNNFNQNNGSNIYQNNPMHNYQKYPNGPNNYQVKKTSSPVVNSTQSACARLHNYALQNNLLESYSTVNQNGGYVVTLTLGNQQFLGNGTNLKMAKEAAASQALRETSFIENDVQYKSSNSGTTATSQLHEIATKKRSQSWAKTDIMSSYKVHLKVASYDFYGQADHPQKAKHIACSNEALAYVEALPDIPKAKNHCAMTNGLCPEWNMVSDQGLPHQRTFTWSLKLGDHEVVGTGSSKKVAKTTAANQMLNIIPEEWKKAVLEMDGKKKKKANKRKKQNLSSPENPSLDKVTTPLKAEVPVKVEDNSTPLSATTDIAQLPSNLPIFEQITSSNPISCLYEYCKKAKFDDPVFECVSENVVETWLKEIHFLTLIAWVIILPILIGIGSIKVPRHFEYISYIQRSEELFEFMKDFRNYQELNPLITYINITEEGPYHQEAEYEEYYETLPSIFMNRSKGKFLVKPHILIIESTHSTCLIMGEYYLSSIKFN
ncbi:unnamed protein product [Lepeophtheirus salmonis]|uniref:(salmon louse) hypothetical protein n=1 Tax=Lepeophtheirus salmonis TaxID=72036 RepID=A0A7R8H1K7_LEPSM|nr:unnamed protein product [Lepeophtheirus salmonis]CAF2809047.1 unnamed protein product [Lepeophtheirus salmonis]